jgi:gas vesicle protein
MSEEVKTEAPKADDQKYTDLAEKVDKLYALVLGKDKKEEPTATATSSVDDQVKAALEKVKADEAEASEKETLKTEVANLKKAMEEKPVEVRKITKFMGWND